jgi:hypothetical protein
VKLVEIAWPGDLTLEPPLARTVGPLRCANIGYADVLGCAGFPRHERQGTSASTNGGIP